MPISTTTMLKRSFDSPDETRPAGAGQAQIINVEDTAMMRITLQPGWRWSRDVKPIAGGDSCQAPHFQYIIQGRMHIKMDDGSEDEFGPGDLLVAPPGHDGWVVGNEEFVCIDVTGGGIWAKPS
ncbi:MAG: cupin domain-containing protein [Chloroflexi bacterium]|nr:cupin domain-containing protein [Chloroflexota bacterium]